MSHKFGDSTWQERR